jgi:hypothetical protein
VTKFTLEGGGDGARVLAGMWFSDHVSVRWFPINVCADATIGQALQMDVKEGNRVIHFFFSRELNSWVDGI